MTNWSPYQDAVFAWANNPERHLMIQAGAGTGKTTTIVQLYKILMEKNPSAKIVFMAFNKKIAEELSLRGVPGMTMNSFGHRIVLKNFPKAKLEMNKLRNLCRTYNVDFKKTNLVTRAVDLLKAYLYPPANTKVEDVQNIINDFELSTDAVSPQFCGTIRNIFEASVEETHVFDFADQISFPIYHNLAVEKYDYVIIDECQDLSPNKLELVSRAVGNKFICVGDPYQAIYGFAGADSSSMDKIRVQFDPIVLSLPVTYRCGKNIVAEAHKKQVAPVDYQAGPTNADGVVETISKEKFQATVQPKDFVLCRLTAPLVTNCFGLIKKGTRAKILGRDVGKKLVDLVDKIDNMSDDHTIEGWCASYPVYRQLEVGKLRKAEKEQQADNLEDSLDCLFVFTEGATTISAMKTKIELMFDDSINPDAVTFSTIHKAKGLEADRVFALSYKGKQPKKEKQIQEEKNLLYVQITRAKSYFAWVGLVLLMVCGSVNAMCKTYSCPDVLVPSVSNAIDMWSFATGIDFVRVPSDADITVHEQVKDLPGGAIGITYPGVKSDIFVLVGDHELEQTMKHEFGHALGLGHTTNIYSIMQPKVPFDGYGCQEDIDNVREILGLSPMVLQFPIKQIHNRNRVVFYGPCLILKDDGVSHFVEKRWVVIYPKGTYTVKRVFHSFQVVRTIVVK